MLFPTFEDKLVKLIELGGYILKGCNSKAIEDIDLKFKYVLFFKIELIEV